MEILDIIKNDSKYYGKVIVVHLVNKEDFVVGIVFLAMNDKGVVTREELKSSEIRGGEESIVMLHLRIEENGVFIGKEDIILKKDS